MNQWHTCMVEQDEHQLTQQALGAVELEIRPASSCSDATSLLTNGARPITL
jgi:hypothetical protein